MNVLIKSEEIITIVFALEHKQAIVIFAIGRLDTFVAFITQVIHVNGVRPKGSKGRVHFTGPGDVRFVGGRIGPN